MSISRPIVEWESEYSFYIQYVYLFSYLYHFINFEFCLPARKNSLNLIA